MSIRSYRKQDLGGSFTVAVGMMLLASVVLGAIFGNPDGGWQFWLMQALYSLAIGASAIVYAAIRGGVRNLPALTKLNVKPRWAHAVWGCVATLFLIFLMTPLNMWLLDGLEQAGLTRPSVDLPDNPAMLIVVCCVLPAFTEELVFRGTVTQSLAGGNTVAAVAVIGALFAVFHANPAQTVHQFVLGGLLALLVLRSGSLWVTIITHLFNNLAVVAFSYTPLGNDRFCREFGWVLALAGLAGFVTCVVGYMFTTKDARAEREPDDADKHTLSSIVLLCCSAAICVALWVTTLLSK